MRADGAARTPARRRAAAIGAAAMLLGLGGCYASNVVAVRDRAVASAALPTEWRPAVAADFVGLHHSIAITGDAALSLQRVYYWFEANGRYTGAALIAGDAGMEFQTLSGTWSVAADGLRLDGQEPVAAEAAPGLLRIRAATGALTLAAEATQ